MSDITSTTTTQEAADISAYYGTDQAAWDAAITSGEVPADLAAEGIEYDDLIAAYVTTYGILPTAYLAPDAYIADPTDYDYLWDDAVLTCLTELGQLNPSTSISAGIDAFTSDLETAGLIDAGASSDLLDEANSFIEDNSSTLNDSSTNADGTVDVNGLMDIANLYVANGDLGSALMMFGVAMEQLGQEMDDAGLGVLNDLYDKQQGYIDDLGNIDPEDPMASYDSQEISQESSANLTTINTVVQILSDFRKAINELYDAASNTSDAEHNSNEVAIRNMA